MKKGLISMLLTLIITSCIPLRIAPHIKTDKVTVAKKFKKTLPKQYAFIFEDPKDANEFYNYVNTKYELEHQDVNFNVPFEIASENYYFSFYEVEIPDKTINFVPFLIDAKLKEKDFDPLFEDLYFTRNGNWYIAITVSDDNLTDCLKPNYIKRDALLNYLKAMRVEYLNTSNYLEALFRK